jgi:hypothetical protein
MSTKNANISVNASGQTEKAPFVVFDDPTTGAHILLVDPEYDVRGHKTVGITAKDAASFAAAVLASPGDNKLIELRDGGEFVYRDNLGDRGINTVNFKLVPSPTAKVLGMSGFTFTQRELLQWKDQWPGSLLPNSTNPEADFEDLTHFKSKDIKTVDIETTDAAVRIRVDDVDESDTKLPLLWKGRSPLFDQHTQQDVTLRMEVKKPDADRQTGEVKGVLLFHFTLWTPASCTVMALAMDDAAAQMGSLLTGYTVIRGTIN